MIIIHIFTTLNESVHYQKVRSNYRDRTWYPIKGSFLINNEILKANVKKDIIRIKSHKLVPHNRVGIIDAMIMNSTLTTEDISAVHSENIPG